MANKILLLLRHAKSSWKQLDLDDHARPLNARGHRAATRMGWLLQEESLTPDLVLCSTAVRTRETADLVFGQVDSVPLIRYLDELYHAEPAGIAEVLMQIGEPTHCVLLIGHNPGMEEFLSQQTGESQHLPTAALARVDFELDTWSQFNNGSRVLLTRVWRPRELDSGYSARGPD